jgi:hypothetical protein
VASVLKINKMKDVCSKTSIKNGDVFNREVNSRQQHSKLKNGRRSAALRGLRAAGHKNDTKP